jgi:hypothetical protein
MALSPHGCWNGHPHLVPDGCVSQEQALERALKSALRSEERLYDLEHPATAWQKLAKYLRLK